MCPFCPFCGGFPLNHEDNAHRTAVPCTADNGRSMVAGGTNSPNTIRPSGRTCRRPVYFVKAWLRFPQTVLGLCAESGFQPRVAYQTSSIQTALSFVKHGLGVTLVPEMVARNNIGPVYLSLASKPTRTLVFAYHKDRYLPNAARSFLDLYDTVHRRVNVTKTKKVRTVQRKDQDRLRHPTLEPSVPK